MKKSSALKERAGAEVEDDVVGAQGLDVPHELELPVMVDVGDEERVLRPADEAEPGEAGGADGVGEGGELAGKEIAHVGMGVSRAEERVKVGGAEVGVDQDDVAAPARPGRSPGSRRRSSCPSRPFLLRRPRWSCPRVSAKGVE